MSIFARGGGRGANTGIANSAGGTHYFISAAQAGGCGGGSIGQYAALSAGHVLDS